MKHSNAVTLTVLFYIFTSISMVVFNKHVLNTVDLPNLLLFLQLIFAVVLLKLSSLIGVFKVPKFNIDICIKLLPLVLVNAIGLSANTYCLRQVDASLYQVARALVLPFTVFLTRIILGKPSSIFVYISCMIICSAFLLGTTFDALEYSSAGFFYGIFSSATTAFHAIIIKKSINIVEGNTMDLVWYNNAMTAFILIPMLFLSGDIFRAYTMFINDFYDYDHLEFMNSESYTFIVGSAITGLFGFLINLAGFLQIKITSPITHMVSSAIRSVLQTLIAIAIFGDIVTSYRWAGILLTLIGSVLYTGVRFIESDRENRVEKIGKYKI